MSDMKSYINESRTREVDNLLESLIEEVEKEGFTVEFGKIGTRTTYALLQSKHCGTEVVGYTFIRNLDYYKENVGKLKALQQAIARKEMMDNPQ